MIGVVRGLFTLVLMILFIAVTLWAWSSRRKPEFDKLARLPLDEDSADGAGARPGRGRRS
jgi:cytochrome c oxidase cbb3-type subunit 4